MKIVKGPTDDPGPCYNAVISGDSTTLSDALRLAADFCKAEDLSQEQLRTMEIARSMDPSNPLFWDLVLWIGE